MTLFTRKPKTYIIKKGKKFSVNHFSIFHFGIVFSNTLTFEVTFDQSCLEDLPYPENLDINKLYGFSESYNHEIYSARVGWRCSEPSTGLIDIVTYCHINNTRPEEKILARVKPGQTIKLSIENTSQFYHFTCITSELTTENDVHTLSNKKVEQYEFKDKPRKWLVKYKLYPYHGGTLPAPHDMIIKITQL